MTILAAIQRLQALALACSSSDVTIRAAPDYPIEDAKNLPMSIAHLASGEGTAVNATDLQFQPIVEVEFHFNRTVMKQAYKEINSVALAFMGRLAGDPTLNSSVDTIIFPVTFEVSPVEWDRIQTQALIFSVPLKTLETPVST
jgi:hypothetical protein